jgi:hypothetical protein
MIIIDNWGSFDFERVTSIGYATSKRNQRDTMDIVFLTDKLMSKSEDVKGGVGSCSTSEVKYTYGSFEYPTKIPCGDFDRMKHFIKFLYNANDNTTKNGCNFFNELYEEFEIYYTEKCHED